MSRWTPCKRREFIRKLQRLGFTGPFAGTRHHFMIYGEKRMSIPSNAEYSVAQLKRLLQEVEAIIERSISLEEWRSI